MNARIEQHRVGSKVTQRSGEATHRVLVVDDERNLRLTLGRALETMGMDVATAASGREALGRLRAQPFRLVFLDLKMPGLHGLDVLRHIRAGWPALPVIIFTAHGSAENATEAMKLGATDFVQKPFTLNEIRRLVRRVQASLPPSAAEEPAGRDRQGRPPGSYRVVVLVTDPATEQALLRLAAASARGHAGGELIAVNVIEVPRQTPLDHVARRENDLRDWQHLILDLARGSADALSVKLRARGLVGHDAGAAVLDVIRAERADHILLGWKSTSRRVLRVVQQQAPCEVTLVKLGSLEIRHVVALAGEGPHAPLAVQRAFEFTQSAGVATLTLLNVQPPAEDADAAREAGRALIRRVAEKAHLPPGKYRPRVIVDEDAEQALLRAAAAYDTICVGASRNTSLAQSLFGSLPETLGEGVAATVAIARHPQYKQRTVLAALAERLPGWRAPR